jgi:hypothetical protein
MKDFLIDKYARSIRTIDRIVLRLKMYNTRRDAHRARKKFVQLSGRSVLNRQVMASIKRYARKRYGSKSYWPFLALYTEVKGRFIEGWIPFDHFLYVLEPRLNPPVYRELGNQKTYDYRRFEGFAIKPLFLYVSGLFYTPDFEIVDEVQLKEFLAAYDDHIVVKQEFGGGGKQVRFIHSSEFGTELLDRNENYVIQPYIKQYRVLHELYPDSVNTLRVTTFLKKDGSVDIVYVILRFGADGSKVDNLSSGGQCIEMDINGKPAKIAYDDYGNAGGERHKNTGFRFADIDLPMYPAIIEQCKAAHLQYPYVRLIGWDVCIDESGVPRLIEWNTDRPTFDMEDALYGPFFPDDSEF